MVCLYYVVLNTYAKNNSDGAVLPIKEEKMIDKVTADNIEEWSKEREEIAKKCFEEFLREYADDEREEI
jgi:hypothetical protein